MTGHSLGAALATLAADRYGEVQGVYTFGSPRVGNRRFGESYSNRTYRFVNARVIVAQIPPSGFYVHVGEPRFIDGERKIRLGPTENLSGPTPCGTNCEEPASPENAHLSKAPFFVPDTVLDHVPLLYAILIWNNLVDAY